MTKLSTSQQTRHFVTPSQIQKEVLADALQHPLTLYPFGLAAALLCLSVFVAPFIGLQALLLWLPAIACSVISAIFFIWNYVVRGASSAEQKAGAAIARQDEKQKTALHQELSQLYASLDDGFTTLTGGRITDARTSEKRKSPQYRELELLHALEREYHKVCDALARHENEQSVVSLREISQLSSETYRQGLNVLKSALELLCALQDTDPQALREEIADLEKELRSLGDDEMHAHRKEIKQETLASLKKRLASFEEYGEHIEKLLAEAETCEASLQEVCAELPLVMSDASETNVDDVANRLTSTIQGARKVQQMLSGEAYREEDSEFLRLGNKTNQKGR